MVVPGQNSAEVQKWLQSMPPSDLKKMRLPTSKLAESLNTEYDVASDWSERDPMLCRPATDSDEAVPTE